MIIQSPKRYGIRTFCVVFIPFNFSPVQRFDFKTRIVFIIFYSFRENVSLNVMLSLQQETVYALLNFCRL